VSLDSFSYITVIIRVVQLNDNVSASASVLAITALIALTVSVIVLVAVWCPEDTVDAALRIVL
jgi:hypothetical protein